MHVRDRLILEWAHAPTQRAATDAIYRLADYQANTHATPDYHEVCVPGNGVDRPDEYVPSDVYHADDPIPRDDVWDAMPEVVQ